MNIKLIYIGIYFLGSVISVHSQSAAIIDTSYTVYSSYKKYIKNFPEIQIVKPEAFENVAEHRNIVYKEIGDRKLLMDAFYNKSEQFKPAVILMHGGGWKSGNKSHMEPMAQFMASQGYACFTVEYRLSAEAVYPASMYDVKSAIKFIKDNSETYKIDTAKIAVLGCSSGGQMAALIGATNNNNSFEDHHNDVFNSSPTVQAVIDIDGILAFKHPESEEGKSASQWLGGTYTENPSNWEKASALTHVNKNTPPILFINSKFKRFHAGRDDMIIILNKNNIYNQTKEFDNSPHTFWLFHPWFDPTVEYVTEFLNKIFYNN